MRSSLQYCQVERHNRNGIRVRAHIPLPHSVNRARGNVHPRSRHPRPRQLYQTKIVNPITNAVASPAFQRSGSVCDVNSLHITFDNVTAAARGILWHVWQEAWQVLQEVVQLRSSVSVTTQRDWDPRSQRQRQRRYLGEVEVYAM